MTTATVLIQKIFHNHRQRVCEISVFLSSILLSFLFISLFASFFRYARVEIVSSSMFVFVGEWMSESFCLFVCCTQLAIICVCVCMYCSAVTLLVCWWRGTVFQWRYGGSPYRTFVIVSCYLVRFRFWASALFDIGKSAVLVSRTRNMMTASNRCFCVVDLPCQLTILCFTSLFGWWYTSHFHLLSIYYTLVTWVRRLSVWITCLLYLIRLSDVFPIPCLLRDLFNSSFLVIYDNL